MYKGKKSAKTDNIIRFDSTIVTLSCKLLNIGYRLKGGDAEKYRLLKFTIGFTDIPGCICLYTEQAFTSENAALPKTIIENSSIVNDAITVFDRGITGRKSYDELTNNNIDYISRINPNAKHTILKLNTLKKILKQKP